jgi:hypothetical protein
MRNPWGNDPDMEAIFGKQSKYKVTMDPSYAVEEEAHREFRRRYPSRERWHPREEKPWLRRVKCNAGGRGAHLYVAGQRSVGFSGAGSAWRVALVAIPGVKLLQRGNVEFSVSFPPEILPQVAAVVQPRVKRTLSDEAKAKAVARLAAYARSPQKTRQEA